MNGLHSVFNVATAGQSLDFVFMSTALTCRTTKGMQDSPL